MLASDNDELTIDQLASCTNTTVRTVRFYASRGLLPPPRLQGRVGLYGPVHVARLELIRELQALGFTLSAIESHVERLPIDADPEDVALHRALLTPWGAEEAERLDLAGLRERTGRDLDEAAIDRLVELGVVERVGEDEVHVPSPAMLAPSLRVVDLELPSEMVLEARRIVTDQTAQIADQLRELFAANVLRPYRERGRPEEERERLRELTDQLRPLTIQLLVHGFQQAVNDVIRKRV